LNFRTQSAKIGRNLVDITGKFLIVFAHRPILRPEFGVNIAKEAILGKEKSSNMRRTD
jgi:hypothetical protein